MRILEVALFVLAFQFSLGLVMASGFISDGFAYDSNLLNYDSPAEMSALNEWEQIGASVNTMNEAIKKVAFWGWIKDYTQPYYTYNIEVRTFVNFLIWGLNIIMGLLVGGAIIEFVVKQHKAV